MIYFKNKLIACGSSNFSACYLYNEANDAWSFFASGGPQLSPRGSLVYNNKLHIFHGENESIFDPEMKAWTTLNIGQLFADTSCTVVYQNTFLVFGSFSSSSDIYQYHTVNSSWIKLDTSSAPMDFSGSGCGVLPDENILIVGSGSLIKYLTAFAVYNVSSNTWVFSGSQNNLPKFYFINVISIGQRVFVFTDTRVLEFHNNNKTFAYAPFITFKERTGRPAIIKVPAAMLDNLQNGCKGIN